MGLERLEQLSLFSRASGFSIDVSGLRLEPTALLRLEPMFQQALKEMNALEAGEIANKDENRRVGHYWLRSPQRAPIAEQRSKIEEALRDVKEFSLKVISGEISPPDAKSFRSLLIIGIGGSALGPQFLSDALWSPAQPVRSWYIDNTDPDGMARTLSEIPSLAETLVVVISKSGGTQETRNGLNFVANVFSDLGRSFAKQAVAITGVGSRLDQQAEQGGWLARFPMWDWIGGRTSVASAVGLLPLALQGHDIDRFLGGMDDMDQLTRAPKLSANPAALLSLGWFVATQGSGEKSMVVLPYKDRLLLFARYLQQLVMESLGKEFDRGGNTVHQGISVYGNKGSTDQHAYVQQLRDGLDNFFVVFVEVLKDDAKNCPESLELSQNKVDLRASVSSEIEDGVTVGDYLAGFLLGTRQALSDRGRETLTVTLREVDEYQLGMLIALFERAVGYYASYVDINAYHQPGVEAGKKAAEQALHLQRRVLSLLRDQKKFMSVAELTEKIPNADDETVFRILWRLKESDRVQCKAGAGSPLKDLFAIPSATSL